MLRKLFGKKTEDATSSDSERKRTISVIAGFVIALAFIGTILWGFIDSIRQSATGYVAMVGNKAITTSDFSNALEVVKSEMSNRDLSPRLSQGLDRFVLRSIIFDEMVDQEMKSVGFAVSDSAIIEALRNDIEYGNIKDITIEKLDSLIKLNSLALKKIISSKVRSIFLSSIIDSMNAGKYGSYFWAEEILRSRLEVRDYDLFQVTKASVSKTEKPTRDDILHLYNREYEKLHSENTFDILFFTSDDLQVDDEVTDQDIQDYYEKSLQKKLDRGRRDITIIVAKNRADADKAQFLLRKNENNFAKVASVFSNVEKKKLSNIGKFDLSNSLAEAVFSVPVGKPTDIVKVDNGFVIAVTERIFSSTGNGIDSAMRNKILSILKGKKHCSKIMQAKEEIKDAISAGLSIEQIATKFNIKLKKHSLNEGADSDPILDKSSIKLIKDSKKYIGRIELSEHPEQCAITVLVVEKFNRGGKVPFASVKGKLEAQWLESAKDKAMYDIAAGFKHRFENNSKIRDNQMILDQIVEVSKITKQNRQSSSRLKGSNRVPSALVDEIFMAKPGEMVGPFKGDDGIYSVAVLRSIKSPSKVSIENMKEDFFSDLSQQRRLDYLDLYEEYLKNKYSVKIGSQYKGMAPYQDTVARN